MRISGNPTPAFLAPTSFISKCRAIHFPTMHYCVHLCILRTTVQRLAFHTYFIRPINFARQRAIFLTKEHMCLWKYISQSCNTYWIPIYYTWGWCPSMHFPRQCFFSAWCNVLTNCRNSLHWPSLARRAPFSLPDVLLGGFPRPAPGRMSLQ